MSMKRLLAGVGLLALSVAVDYRPAAAQIQCWYCNWNPLGSCWSCQYDWVDWGGDRCEQSGGCPFVGGSCTIPQWNCPGTAPNAMALYGGSWIANPLELSELPLDGFWAEDVVVEGERVEGDQPAVRVVRRVCDDNIVGRTPNRAFADRTRRETRHVRIG